MESLKLSVYIYAIIKEYINRLNLIKNDFVVVIAAILTITLVPITLLIHTTLYLYKMFILKCAQYVNKDFIRPLDGLETVMVITDNCIPFCTFYIDYDKGCDNLKQNLINKVQDFMVSRHKKLFYSVRSFMGYYYYYQTHLSPEKYVRVVQIPHTEELNEMNYVSLLKLDNHPLPNNNEALFELVIPTKPIKLKQFRGLSYLYPVTFRIHHAVTDGNNWLNFITNVLADQKRREIQDKAMENAKKVKSTLDQWHDGSKFLHNVRIKDFVFNVVYDKNDLRGYNLNEIKHCVVFSDSTEKYMLRIKAIRKIASCTFLDVLNTAIAKSLYDYYKLRNYNIPKYVSCGVALALNGINMDKQFVLENNFSCGHLRVPIDECGDDIAEKLKIVQQEYRQLRTSFDAQFNYGMQELLFNYIPAPILKYMSKIITLTYGLSSILGTNTFSIFDCTVKDMHCYPPNSVGTGLHFVVYSYGGNLRISLTADSSIIPTFKDAELIVNNIPQAIDLLYAKFS